MALCDPGTLYSCGTLHNLNLPRIVYVEDACHPWQPQKISRASVSQSKSNGDQLTVLPLSLPLCPRQGWKSEDKITKSIVAWCQVHLRTTICSSMFFVMASIGWKSSNRTSLLFRSGGHSSPSLLYRKLSHYPHGCWNHPGEQLNPQIEFFLGQYPPISELIFDAEAQTMSNMEVAFATLSGLFQLNPMAQAPGVCWWMLPSSLCPGSIPVSFIWERYSDNLDILYRDFWITVNLIPSPKDSLTRETLQKVWGYSYSSTTVRW